MCDGELWAWDVLEAFRGYLEDGKYPAPWQLRAVSCPAGSAGLAPALPPPLAAGVPARCPPGAVSTRPSPLRAQAIAIEGCHYGTFPGVGHKSSHLYINGKNNIAEVRTGGRRPSSRSAGRWPTHRPTSRRQPVPIAVAPIAGDAGDAHGAPARVGRGAADLSGGVPRLHRRAGVRAGWARTPAHRPGRQGLPGVHAARRVPRGPGRGPGRGRPRPGRAAAPLRGGRPQPRPSVPGAVREGPEQHPAAGGHRRRRRRRLQATSHKPAKTCLPFRSTSRRRPTCASASSTSATGRRAPLRPAVPKRSGGFCCDTLST